MIEHLTQVEKTPREGRFPLAAQVLAVIGAILYVASWLVPNHYPPWVSFHNDAVAFAALTFLWASGTARTHLPKPSAVVGVIALCIPTLIAVQLATGQIVYFGDALVSCIYVFGFAAALWLGALYAADMPSRSLVLSVFAALTVVVGIASVWIALVQWLGIDNPIGFNTILDLPPHARPFGNLGQPNHFATLLLMAVAMTGVLVVQGVVSPWLCGFLVSLLSVGVVLAASRAAWLSLFVIAIFWGWKGRKIWGTKSLALPAFLALGLYVVSILMKLLADGLLLGGGGGRAIVLYQDNTRWIMWRQSLDAILQSPWQGYGWRQTTVAQKFGALLHPGDFSTDYAHSVVFDVIIWAGLPIGLLILFAVACWLMRLGYNVANGTQLMIFTAVIPFATHSLVEFPYAYAYFLLPVAWLLGYLVQVQQAVKPELSKTRLCVRVAVIGAVLCYAVSGVGVIYEYLLAEEDYRVMRFETRSVGHVPVGYDPPKLVLLTQLGEMLTMGRWEPYRGMSPDSIERFRVANANFAWATLQLKLIVAYAINGQMPQAAHELKSLRSIYGEKSYLQAVKQLQDLTGKYPELTGLQYGILR